MRFVHAAGTIRGDLTYANVFFDAALNAKLADLKGSSIDGNMLLVRVMTSHGLQGPLLCARGPLRARLPALRNHDREDPL